MQEIAGVDGCQVVGVTVGTTAGDALRPVGFVTLKGGATLDEPAALRHVAAKLARY